MRDTLPKIESIGEFIEIISQNVSQTTTKPIYCFRGEDQDFGKTSLLPGIFRKDQFNFQLEKDMLYAFINNGYDLISPHLRSDVEKLIIGQHYGLPTRFLDWTLNPLIALFFSVENDEHKNKDGFLYALPIKNNLFSLANDVQNMSIDSINELDEQKIKLFYVSNICPRIKSQSGMFSIHFQDNQNAGDVFGLHKYMIPRESKSTIKKQLSICNITEKTVYVTLDNLAKNIKAEYYG